MRILHVINSLAVGGAEMMLYKLLSATDRTQFKPVVISLIDGGGLAFQIEKLGIPIYTIGMQGNKLSIDHVWKIISLTRHLKPDLIQGWMYHGNLAATLSAIFYPGTPVLWNIRQSIYDLRAEKRMTAVMVRLGAYLSTHPKHILYNAQISAQQHEALGYAPQRRKVIPNGFDCERFKPSVIAHKQLCNLLGVPEDTILIGLIARYDRMKDHRNFIQAAQECVKRHPSVQFILAGANVTMDNQDLAQQIQSVQLNTQMYLLGERNDIPEITAGLDIATCSSWSEGFPNVVGEAMACGIPCVATNVGDSAWLMGDAGLLIPPRDPVALAQAWSKLIEFGPRRRAALGIEARQRILAHFSLPEIVRRYETLYLSTVK